MKLFGIKIGRVKKKQPKAVEETKTEEVPREKVPKKVRYEIVREKDERSVLVKKGNIKPQKEWVGKKIDGVRRLFYANHIIKETKKSKDFLGRESVKVRYFVRWTLRYSEAYNKDGKVVYDPALENHLMNDMMGQLGKAVAAAVGLVLDRTTITLLILALVFGIPIGLSFNDIFHWVPNTVIHWVPRT